MEAGLDCVGLAALALRAGGYDGPVPGGYALRRGDAEAVAAMIAAAGFAACDPATPGALLLCRSAPGQLHCAIATGAGLVHADAMLGRVVERPGASPWPVLGAWAVSG